jgi:hypothetical protein
MPGSPRTRHPLLSIGRGAPTRPRVRLTPSAAAISASRNRSPGSMVPAAIHRCRWESTRSFAWTRSKVRRSQGSGIDPSRKMGCTHSVIVHIWGKCHRASGCGRINGMTLDEDVAALQAENALRAYRASASTIRRKTARMSCAWPTRGRPTRTIRALPCATVCCAITGSSSSSVGHRKQDSDHCGYGLNQRGSDRDFTTASPASLASRPCGRWCTRSLSPAVGCR